MDGVAASSASSNTSNISCKYFKLGQCLRGSSCSYSHEEEMPKSVVPCKFFQRGTCAFGRKCRFDHVRVGASGSTQPAQGTSVQPSSANVPDTKSKPKITTRSWADAPEFVPASARPGAVVQGKSYAAAAGGNASQDPYHQQVDYGTGFNPELEDELCPYALAGECRYGSACLYIHGLPCDLCGYQCLHPYNEVQRKEHRKECVAKHEEDMRHSFELAASMDKQCSICFDTILEKTSQSEQRFGILPMCNHVFCLACIRKWRQQKENVVVPTKTARACPACRIPSDFVIPSRTWVEDKEQKAELIRNYKENMRKKHCKHFNFGDGQCQFGNKCFYKHETRDGKKVDVGPPKRRVRQNADGEIEMLQQMLMWDFIESADVNRSFFLDFDFMSDSDESDDAAWFQGDGSDYDLEDEESWFD